MSTLDPLTVAKDFATALDRCDFAKAALYLSPDCHYQARSEELIGPDAIVASYRDSAEWASLTLEQVIYESEVQKDGDDLSVLYTDHIMHQGQTHEYRSRQHLTINGEGKVIRIVHEELPGEREKLHGFFVRCGVRR